MLEKPPLPEEKIIACLQAAYGLPIAEVAFLPLGADRHTAVYRVLAHDGTPYFFKRRDDAFDETSVALPKFLADQGIAEIIAPLPTKTGQLWASLDAFSVILYPFVDGRDGYQVDLLDRHWVELGAALKRIHTAPIPPGLVERIPRETYSSQWRESLKRHLDRVGEGTFADDLAASLAAFLVAHRDAILDLVGRADRLARALVARAPSFTVCHSDIHAGNIFIDTAGALYIVDWDDAIRAPKERDLMFAGGGQFGTARTPQEEETLFYQGYGQTVIDPIALAYYRYERIVQDLAIYCDQIFLSTAGSQDRKLALRYLISNFQPNETIQVAYDSDKTKQAD